MQLKILYFAGLRDEVGASEEELDADAETIGALAELLALRHPALRARLGSVRFARNEAFASLDEKLSSGDVVALLPPVAGG